LQRLSVGLKKMSSPNDPQTSSSPSDVPIVNNKNKNKKRKKAKESKEPVAKARLLRQPKAPLVYEKTAKQKKKKKSEQQQQKPIASIPPLTAKDGWIRDAYVFRVKNKDKIDEKTQELKMSDEELLDEQLRIYDYNKQQMYPQLDANGQRLQDKPVGTDKIAWALKWFFPVSKIRPPPSAIVSVLDVETGAKYRTATFGTMTISQLAPDQNATILMSWVKAAIDEKTGKITAEIIEHPAAFEYNAKQCAGTEKSLQEWHAKHYLDYTKEQIEKMSKRTTQDILHEIQTAQRKQEIENLERVCEEAGQKGGDSGAWLALQWQEAMIKDLGGQDKYDAWCTETLAKQAVTDKKLILRQSLIVGCRVFKDKFAIHSPQDLKKMTPEEKKALQERLVAYAKGEGKSPEEVKAVAQNLEQVLAPETEERKLQRLALDAKKDFEEDKSETKDPQKAIDATLEWLAYILVNEFKSDPLKMSAWRKNVLNSTRLVDVIDKQLVKFVDEELAKNVKLRKQVGIPFKEKEEAKQVTVAIREAPSFDLGSEPEPGHREPGMDPPPPPPVTVEGLKCNDCIFRDWPECTHLNKDSVPVPIQQSANQDE
jgi:hypothetical protein